jgi:elongation factor Ts
MITKEDVKALRDQTGISFMQCRKALEESNGDMEKALLVLQKASGKAALKKADRELGAGVISSYIHNNKQVGVLIELNCETDFVAKNEEFLKLADDIAMHVAAMSPSFISQEEITEDDRKKMTDILTAEEAAMDASEKTEAKSLEEKLSDYFTAQTLLSQAYVKNPEQTIDQLIQSAIQKIGEKIEIGQMVRFGVLEA